MAFTYDNELGDPVSRLRRAVGDVDRDDQLAPDETYEGYLRLYGVSLSAAAVTLGEKKAQRDALRGIAAEVAREPTRVNRTGEGSVDWAARVPTWLALADQLDKELAASSAARQSLVRLPLVGTFLRWVEL